MYALRPPVGHTNQAKSSCRCYYYVLQATQYLCSSRNWNTPVTMDLKGGLVILIQQAERLVFHYKC